jgi:predicted PurR-regulated permease PerM
VKDVPTQPFLTRTHIFTIAFFVAFLFLLYQAGRLLAPFSGALLWAGVLALALHPLYLKLVRLFRGNTYLAAGLMTMITLLMVVGPVIGLLTVLVSQTLDLYRWVSEGITSGSLLDVWNRLSASISRKIFSLPFVADMDIKGLLVNGLHQFSSGLTSHVGAVLRDTLVLFFNLFIMLTALYFFFRHGERYYETAMDLLPFREEQKRSIACKLHDTFTAVINGVFLIALGQGVMTGIGFAIFGISFPVFWGFLAAVLALLPFGGAALVWIPGALFLLLTKATLKGVLLAVWGLVLVSLPDNFIRPFVIGKRAKLPTFFLFFGILGGLQVFGFLGILFGPLIVTVLTAFIQIYRDEFAEIKTDEQ